MKIALLSEYKYIGGGESNLLTVASELSQFSDITIIATGLLVHKADSLGLHTIEMNLTGRRWIKGVPLIWPEKRLSSLLSGYDVIHAYSLNILPRLFYINKPLIWTNHGYWEGARGLRASIISHFVDHVVTVSRDVYNSALDISTEKSIIPLGVQVDQYASIQPAVVRPVFNVLCVGRFQYIKGQDILILALDELIKTRINQQPVELHFVGDVNGDDFRDNRFLSEVKQLVSAMSESNIRVYFHGFQQNIKPYLKDANLVVIPSRYESFSMVTVEALASGRPVVAPDVGGPAEIINSERVGLLFCAGDKSSLADSLGKAIDRYHLFDYHECLKRAKDFSVKKQAESLMKIYSRFIKK